MAPSGAILPEGSAFDYKRSLRSCGTTVLPHENTQPAIIWVKEYAIGSGEKLCYERRFIYVCLC